MLAFSDWPISILNWVYIFPRLDFPMTILKFSTLRSVRREAYVCFKMYAFSKSFLNFVPQEIVGNLLKLLY